MTTDDDKELDATEERITPLTLCRYLIGDRGAILQVANCPNIWILGLLFVISAGFAREYDGESLLHEPWHLLLPVVASLATSSILFLMVSLVAYRRGASILSVDGYRKFLGLFWMTAPMAWLYAIPVERFLPAGAAAGANMSLLGVVAVWRVVLIIRVIIVAYGARSIINVASIVLLFSDVVMVIAVILMPTPVIAIMGGVRLTEGEQVIMAVSWNLRVWGVLSAPIWLSCFLWAVNRREPQWRLPNEATKNVAVSKVNWILGAAAVIIWLPILPLTQPEQQRRYRVERELKQGEINAALAQMSNSERADFPPHWDPPPRPSYGLFSPDLNRVMESIADNDAIKPWVRELYSAKYVRNIKPYRMDFDGEDSEFYRLIGILERIPEARREFVKERREYAKSMSTEESIPEAMRERVRRLLEAADP